MATERKGPAGPTMARLGSFGLAGLLALAALSMARPPQPAPPASPWDEALRLTTEARTAYSGIQDYTCWLIKRERVNGGVLPPTNIIAMKFRERPFSVHLKWSEPREQAGQEVSYVVGRNGGKMRVKPKGVLSAFGWQTLDVNDPRVRQASRHVITDAGIGKLIESCARGYAEEKALGQTKVRVDAAEYNKLPCMRVETVRAAALVGKVPHQRTVIYFDKASHLPIRVERYGWPTRAGTVGELDEEFNYVSIQTNVGLGDAAFGK